MYADCPRKPYVSICTKSNIDAWLAVWNSDTAMNKFSQQLALSTIVFAMTAFGAHAESIGSAPAPGTPVTMHQMINPSEPLQPTNDTTLSSFSSTATLVVRTNSGKPGLLFGDLGVSLITPSNGKVVTIENIDHASRSQVDAAVSAPVDPIATTDSTTDGTDVDSASQIVADFSDNVTGADPSDISIATASSTQASGAGSQTFTSADLTPVNSSPEPSTLLFVSSVLIGLGCFRRRRTN
jgi:hypothetical protein